MKLSGGVRHARSEMPGRIVYDRYNDGPDEEETAGRRKLRNGVMMVGGKIT